MNNPRIRHLVAPTMSVADRNLSITNEVRTIMTTAALPLHSTRQGALETAVSRLAVSMLRWSSRRTNRRADRAMVDHERMLLTRDNDRAVAEAVDYRYVARIL